MARQFKSAKPLAKELAESHLADETLALLKSKAAGVMTIGDFMLDLCKIKPHFRLGLDHHRLAWKALQQVTRLSRDSYAELGIPKRSSQPFTDLLMERLSSAARDGKPIVFFVPREVFSHGSSNATAAELRWLLEHPQELEHVYFVFGAYDVLRPDGYEKLSFAFADGDKESEALSFVYEEMHRR